MIDRGSNADLHFPNGGQLQATKPFGLAAEVPATQNNPHQHLIERPNGRSTRTTSPSTRLHRVVLFPTLPRRMPFEELIGAVVICDFLPVDIKHE